MDSGNSGSLQSSSGGDDDSLSSLFNNYSSPATHVTSFNPPPPPPPPPSFFDPLQTYFDNLSRSNNPDPIWPRSDEPVITNNTQPSSSNNQIEGARNPRKRTRASRRAPTTVLTTDTTNFRAMVQEFTGIPSPPFGAGGRLPSSSSSSLFFPRTRLDLFGGRMDAPPPYLLRPHAQKIPPPIISTITTTNKNGCDVMPPSSSGTGNYQMPFSTNLSFGSSLKYQSDDTDPGLGKSGSGGSLELPITTKVRTSVNDDVTEGFLATDDAVNCLSGKDNGEGPFGWAEGLGLGADAGNAGPSAPSATPAALTRQRPQNLGFAHQQNG